MKSPRRNGSCRRAERAPVSGRLVLYKFGSHFLKEIVMKNSKRKNVRLNKFKFFRFIILILIIICIPIYFHHSAQVKKAQAISETIQKASVPAAQYDYKKAISILKDSKYSDAEEIQEQVEEYTEKQSELVAVSPDSITHVFFHSLVVDPSRGFSLTGKSSWDAGTPGFCQWMTTVDEYKEILRQMYKRDFVLVDLKDICDSEMNEKEILLPKNKKAFVLSLDDLSYYHSYDNRGVASKMVLDDHNKPVCEYYTKDGKKKTGAYDCVPILDQFIKKHPDFSYKGAKGTIALTGYNGVLGYRTDTTYRDKTNLDQDQEEWLEAHPDFDWDKECKEAKKVADAMKKDGWNFASHTWGHIRAGQTPLEGIQRDTKKWKTRVEPVVGKTDIIIFAHGEDLAIPEQYPSSDKFKYLYDQGYRYFCNVDGRVYTTLIGDTYFHQGRRNLDGYRMYQAKFNDSTMLDDLFDVDDVWDKNRPDDESLYQL